MFNFNVTVKEGRNTFTFFYFCVWVTTLFISLFCFVCFFFFLSVFTCYVFVCILFSVFTCVVFLVNQSLGFLDPCGNRDNIYFC